jgi:hypothetical protein
LLLRLRVAKNAQGEDAINAIIQRLLHWQNWILWSERELP